MPNYFVKSSAFSDENCVIDGEDFHHLVNVRRITTGVSLSLVDENEQLFDATVQEVLSDRIVCSVTPKVLATQPIFPVCLYAAVLKGKKFDTVIQKAVEIGVSQIVPVNTERCVPDYGEKSHVKSIRWQRIAEEAAKQSLRTSVPDVADIMAFNHVIDSDKSNIRLIAHPAAALTFREYIKNISAPKSAAVLIGPEGGFSPNEIKHAQTMGWTLVSLDFPQLRAETAAIVIPAVVIYELSGRK